MGYVPKREHDVFVSYAHIDNEPMTAGHVGWVDALAEKLQIEVSQRLGSRDVKLWMDRQLDGNHPITPEIFSAIERSATLLVVMSPSYLNSEWCRRERTAFLSLIRGRVAEGSVFVVFAREVNRADVPPEFGDLEGFRFWVQDAEARADRPLGLLDHGERAYISRIIQLSHDLKRQLEQLRAAAMVGHAAPAPAPPDRPSVFVARSTEDLEDREDELKSYLSQAEINILPQTWYPQSGPDAFESAMRQDLARCKAFVQLLSASRGRELAFAPTKRYPRLQYDVAAATGLPRLLWRDRSLDPESVRDPEQRTLVELARASSLEEFKRAVLDEAQRAPEPQRTAPPSVMVFVNADSRDRELAQNVSKVLMEQQVECYWPLASGTPEAIRHDLEENLGNCDGVLLIYGSSGAAWVRSQLRQGRKIISQRERPLNALAVYEGPPSSKEELAVAIPNLLTLNCRDGFDDAALSRFISTLRR